MIARLTAALALAVGLGGCLPAAVIPGAVLGAATLYCAAASDAGKAMARDAMTGGVPLIACPDAEPVQPHQPASDEIR
ncbi:hypothetical protein [uncultured Rhodospira sp.]|uniref:hypothetical protein n=1 Tax=uncultured Rhodospira sp. TaxID=1936189 RepID=UPI0026080120|nr:hypothetical protein [uncultured Rhodospira sp.]